ncbi:MAG TPA: hypothetical protein VGE11_04710, partial [Pseudonocardia sp.]
LSATDDQRLARVLSAWSISSNISIAGLTALWGLLATVTDPRFAIAAAGVLLLATPFLLRRADFATTRVAGAMSGPDRT